MYEEYMQNLLGMNFIPRRNTYEQIGNNTGCCMQINRNDEYAYMINGSYSMNSQLDLEEMYPEIYKIIYPMIRKVCMQNSRPITRELVEEMTQEVYSNIETDNVVNLNISIDNNTNSRGANQEITENEKVENRDVEKRKNESDSSYVKNMQIENRQVENRQLNRGLNDLIKILIIRELVRQTEKWKTKDWRTNK